MENLGSQRQQQQQQQRRRRKQCNGISLHSETIRNYKQRGENAPAAGSVRSKGFGECRSLSGILNILAHTHVHTYVGRRSVYAEESSIIVTVMFGKRIENTFVILFIEN